MKFTVSQSSLTQAIGVVMKGGALLKSALNAT